MPDFLETGVEWLADSFAEGISQSITYRRGSRSVTTTASPTQAQQVYTAEFGGTYLQRDLMDFLIRASDLVLSGSEIEPAQGDLIDYDGRRYLVIGDKESPCFERDEYGIGYVVHTKFRAVI